MKTRILLVAAVALIALAAAVALSRSALAPCRMAAPADVNDIGWLTKELRLDAGQAAKVAALQPDFTKKVNECCAAHCSARFDLGQVLASADVKPADAQSCIERMAQAQRDNDLATFRHLMDLRQVLTPEQWTKLRGILQKQLAGACPMNAHSSSNL